jgi:NAD-dependent SIR2 family protein deacetylase
MARFAGLTALEDPPWAAQSGALQDFIARHQRIFVLTGAGCSTPSGIPDYRDAQGSWKQKPPMNYQTFVGGPAARQRYWARSMIGWPRMAKARPNGAHLALARLEGQGKCELLVTQNVDGLHRIAGSTNTIDLHGRLDEVCCIACGNIMPRAALQAELIRLNPHWAEMEAASAPDGDASLECEDFSSLSVQDCADCGGVLKPNVVFFGEAVPRARVETAYRHLERADAMLVVGSSLMVYSGFRFVDAAIRAGKPVAAVNLGLTRADAALTFKVEQECQAALSFLL